MIDLSVKNRIGWKGLSSELMKLEMENKNKLNQWRRKV